MARYKHSYDGERRTVLRATKFTPSEAAALDGEAARQQSSWSDFSRQTMLGRVGIPVITAENRWDDRLVQALTFAGHAHSSVGNLLKQLARHLHTAQDLDPFAADLGDALGRYDDVAKMHKAVLSQIAAATITVKDRRDPKIAQALTFAGHAYDPIGNLLNPIARHLHTAQKLDPFAADLRDAFTRYNDVARMHKAALVNVGLL